MSKVTLSGHITASEEELASVREALPSHIAKTRSEPGCIVFKVKESAEQKGRFDVYEEFESKAAFESPQKRVPESDWGRITKNVVRHYSIDGLDD